MSIVPKNRQRRLWVGVVCVVVALGVGCRAAPASSIPTSTATIMPTETPIERPTMTPVPRPVQATATPPPTATPVPVATSVPTAVPTSSPEVSIDRSCPDVVPPADYSSYVRSEAPWPTGNDALPSRPLLRPPLSAADETRINWGFPYGSDGSGRYLLHNGLDMTQWPGAPVLAVADGTIRVAGTDASERYGLRCDWYGQLVVLELDERWNGLPVFALYGHVRGLLVEPGQRVTAGEPLAEIGAGGVATVPHLHLEIRVGENEYDATRNPVLWLGPDEVSGVIAGRLLDADGHAWEGVRLTLIDVTGESEFLTTWTYLDDPQDLIAPDEQWAENFVFGEVPPGQYDLYTALEGAEYRQRLTVEAGQISFVEMRTDAQPAATGGP